MELFLVLAGVTKVALELINTEESKELFRKVEKLEKEYHEEFSKDEDSRSQLYLDERLHDLKSIAKNASSYLPKK